MTTPKGEDGDMADAKDSMSATQGGDELAAATARLAGRYAHYDIVAYEGSFMNAMIISYGFTDLSLVDGRLMAQESFCYSEFQSDQPVSVTLSDAATQAIQPIATEVTVTLADGGRAHVFRPETPTGIGIRLENPAEDCLPTDPNDPRISDDDGDGKPGVTAIVTHEGKPIGEIYLARREIFAYDLIEQPDGSLIGVVKDRSEQLIVGASDDIYKITDPWTQHPDLSKSPIILRNVERSWDCAQLRAQRHSLFPSNPPMDY